MFASDLLEAPRGCPLISEDHSVMLCRSGSPGAGADVSVHGTLLGFGEERRPLDSPRRDTAEEARPGP